MLLAHNPLIVHNFRKDQRGDRTWWRMLMSDLATAFGVLALL
jgi:hypothetical protein